MAPQLDPDSASTGRLDLGDAPRISQMLKDKFARLTAVDREHRGRHYNLTHRLFDEARPGGTRTYIHAHQLIGTARENYEALFALLQSLGATPFAPYNLIRPAFEAAFHALWILDPDDGKERSIRGLRVAVEDNRQRRNWTVELSKVPSLTDTDRQKLLAPVDRTSSIYRAEATALGVAWATVAQRPNVEREIPKLSPVADSDRLIRHTMVAGWKRLSGYQHGHAYAVVAGSDRSVDTKIPGGISTRMTINDQNFGLALQMASLMQMWAIETYVRRTVTRAGDRLVGTTSPSQRIACR